MRTYNIFAVALTVTFGLAGTSHADNIAWYEFDSDYNDSSGLGNDGTASGDTALSGPFTGVDGVGGAAQFSGQGHVVIPINSNPSVYPDMTVTMWVKADPSIVSAPGLYKTFGHDDGGWDRTFGLDARLNSGAQAPENFRWTTFTGGAGPGPTPDILAPVTDEWTFIATVWDSDEPAAGFNSVTFYQGGVGEANLSTTRPLTNTPSVHTTSAIGNLRPDNFNEGFVGLIDNVTIHDAALSAGQIAEWKAATIPEPTSLTLLAMALIGLGITRRR